MRDRASDSLPVAEHPVRRTELDTLAGLPACGAGFLLRSPPSRPSQVSGDWDLSGHGRGGGCYSGWGFNGLSPYRIPSSPVVGQEPALEPTICPSLGLVKVGLVRPEECPA